MLKTFPCVMKNEHVRIWCYVNFLGKQSPFLNIFISNILTPQNGQKTFRTWYNYVEIYQIENMWWQRSTNGTSVRPRYFLLVEDLLN